MEKPLLLQGKIPKLQQLFGKNWLQYGRACCQSRVVGGRVSKSVCSPKKVSCHFICGILNRFIIAASVWKAPTSHTILLIPWCNVQTSRFSIISGTIWANSFVVSGLNCNKINWRCNSTGAYPNSIVYHYLHLYESICIGLLRYYQLYLETTIKTWCTGISRRCSAIECHCHGMSEVHYELHVYT